MSTECLDMAMAEGSAVVSILPFRRLSVDKIS